MSTNKTSSSQAQSGSSGNTSSVSTKPVHPVTLSSFAPTGCELCCWAYITTPRPEDGDVSNDMKLDDSNHEIGSPSQIALPNLVVAHSNSLRIYVVDPNSGTMLIASSYENLAGSIVTLDAIEKSFFNSVGEMYDGLLLGFGGHPRMSIVYPSGEISSDVSEVGDSVEIDTDVGWNGVLAASSILDLTPALIEHSKGSLTSLEQDLVCSVTCSGKTPTVCVILGGGVAVALFHLFRSNFNKSTTQSSWWRVANEPYIIPLHNLSPSLQSSQKTTTPSGTSGQAMLKFAKNLTSNTTTSKVSHGFGDILSSAFLNGYTEPVVTLLHSNPYRCDGRSCPERLGHNSSSTRNPLTLTAVSVSVAQCRSVILWSLCDAMPSDALALYQHPKGGVLVVCVNEILYVDCSGKILCCVAVNGWVRSTASSVVRPKSGFRSGIMQPNPSPLQKLSIQLDGCRLTFLDKSLAILSLRNGTLYSLQIHEKETVTYQNFGSGNMCLSLSPIGKKVGGLGMISALAAIPLSGASSLGALFDSRSKLPHLKKEVQSNNDGTKRKEEDSDTGKESNSRSLCMGLVFAGSRMGDSTLMMYGVKDNVKLVSDEDNREMDKHTTTASKIEENETAVQIKRKKEEAGLNKDGDSQLSGKKARLNTGDSNDLQLVSEDETTLSEEELLSREEEILYEEDPDHGSNRTILKSQKSENIALPGHGKQIHRPQIHSLSIFHHVKVLDSLTGLGPLGPGCEGPIACDLASPNSLSTSLNSSVGIGSTMKIHPCGYGASGGLAIVTSPGLNYGSTIVSEADCRGMGSIYHCSQFGLVILAKKEINSGCMVLKSLRNKSSGTNELVEVELESLLNDDGSYMEASVPTFFNVKDVLTRMTILSVGEFMLRKQSKVESYLLFAAQYGESFALVILSGQDSGKLTIAHTHIIGSCDEIVSVERREMMSFSFSEKLNNRDSKPTQSFLVGCVWSSGLASVFSIGKKNESTWEVQERLFNCCENERDQSIVAIDMFSIASNVFQSDEQVNGKTNSIEANQNPGDGGVYEVFDEDDLELYGKDLGCGIVNDLQCQENQKQSKANHTQIPPFRYNTLGGYISGANLSESNESVIAICRQSGQLQIFNLNELFKAPDFVQTLTTEQIEEALLWNSTAGCGHGMPRLSPNVQAASPYENSNTAENIVVSEFKFFFCGPSITLESEKLGQKDLSILRSLCLLVLTNLGDVYLYSGSRSKQSNCVVFDRVSLRVVTRQSKEEQRHRNKLRRKGMVVDDGESGAYKDSKLHRYFSISGQDGLFSATSRPLWFLSERGAPVALNHRLRHSAPAGGATVPICGFCSGLTRGSSKKTRNVGFVTVHERIGRVGSQRLTLFSGLSDVFTPFGILPGGGQFIQKIPLGVTVHQVEYIHDRAVSTAAHPLYALLVSREVDSDQSHLNDDGLTTAEREEMKKRKEDEKMQKQVEADLGGFEVEQEWVEEIERENCFEIEKKYGGAPPISKKTYEIWLVDASDWQMLDTFQLEEYEHGMTMKMMTLSDISENNDDRQSEMVNSSDLLVVGTGIVDDDGEDVSSRGRILLFQTKRTSTNESDSIEAEFIFLYDKEISIGPVSSLSNLACENKSRLVVGAGAEVTIEQWGNGKLLQVGFHHAKMHVQDIVLFKTFLMLSDAYDSVYFLVWRESDKSLTLLAKDYEPNCVYASGIMSRGGALSFVTHDDRQNLCFFGYAPNEQASRGGNKLVCRADCHLGQQTIGFTSHFCRSSLVVNSATIQSTLVALKQQEPFFGKLDDDQRFALHYGSTDGQTGCIIPVNENIYWRLTALQSVMSNALESDCALSPRSWRFYRRSSRRGGCKSNVRRKGVIDGDLVLKYVDLNLMMQDKLASAIGTTKELILDNLLELTSNCII